jgi:glycosyltransferase involved in cell wall biosynthesis
MKVLYDHQIFWYQKYGGISKYFAELMSSAQKNNLFDFEFSAKFSNNEYIKDKYFSRVKQFLPKIDFVGKRTLFSSLNYLNQKSTLNYLEKKEIDLFHPTYYQNYYLNKIKIPFVLTVYDLIPEKFPEYFPKGEFNKEKENLFERANKLICISNNTKKDLIKFYNVPKEKISVIHLASNKNNILKVDNLPHRYILFVGSRGKYKNFNFFVESISKLLIKNKDLFLVCVGDKFSKDEINLFNDLKISNKLKQFNANEQELTYLYKRALFFVFPSLYEGFGIPILEAMSQGCPVALSNTSCFPEIAQKNAAYFDPYNKESIKNCVEDLIVNEKKRKLLSKKGLKRAKEFSWEKTAKETKKVYEKVLK